MMNHSLAKDTALWWPFPVSVVSVSMLHIATATANATAP